MDPTAKKRKVFTLSSTVRALTFLGVCGLYLFDPQPVRSWVKAYTDTVHIGAPPVAFKPLEN